MAKYQCTVCGYSELLEPPYDPHTNDPSFNICPCCGCEFGYNDITLLARQRHLDKWLNSGSPWFIPELRPHNWDVKTQLKLVGINFNDNRANDAGPNYLEL